LWSAKSGNASEKAEPATAAAIDDFLHHEKELLPYIRRYFGATCLL